MTLHTVFAQDTEIEKAEATSQEWLALIDSGNYEKSWQNAASLFRSVVTEEQWKQSVFFVQDPLGKVVSRRLKQKNYTGSIPGGPDGEYVVIRYETEFTNKKNSVETVTPMKDRDGIWRVSGYCIR